MPPAEKIPEIVTVGRMVHFVPGGAGARHEAAIVVACGVTGIEDDVNLQVFRDQPDGVTWESHIPYDPTGKRPHSWHWPERDNGLKGMQAQAAPPTVPNVPNR